MWEVPKLLGLIGKELHNDDDGSTRGSSSRPSGSGTSPSSSSPFAGLPPLIPSPSPSHQTEVGRWQHANPALAGPLQCQFPP